MSALMALPAMGESCPHDKTFDEDGWVPCGDCLFSDDGLGPALRERWRLTFTCFRCGIGSAFYAKDEADALHRFAVHYAKEHGGEGDFVAQLANFYLDAGR